MTHPASDTPPSSPSDSPSGTARRRSRRRSNRCWPRRSRTGSSSSPTTSRPTGRRRSAPRSRRATSVSAMSRPDAISRSTRTSVRRSTTRVARTSAGTETTTGSSPRMRNAPSQRSKGPRTPSSARPFSSTTATARPLPVNDPVPLSAVWTLRTPVPGFARCSTCSRTAATSESTPCTRWYGGTSRHRPAYKAPSATATSCTRARWRSSARLSTYRRSWRIADWAVSRIGLSRNFLQREQSILCVARSKSLTARSRARLCAALVGFAAREHAHGPAARAHRHRATLDLTARCHPPGGPQRPGPP